MKRLFLLRHAKAERGTPGGDDAVHSLSQSGFADIERLGRFLNQQQLYPDLALCSTAARTHQTLESLIATWQTRPEIRFLPELYLAEPATIFATVGREGGHARAPMVVGHNPGLGECARQLAHGARSADPTFLRALDAGFPTSSLAVFAVPPGPWSKWKDDGELERFVRPGDLYAEE